MDTKAYDRFTGAIREITTDHSYIHDGIGFSFTSETVVNGSAFWYEEVSGI